LQNCKITKKKCGPVTAIAWWGEDHEEPLFLVTNFRSASKACEYYSMRFTIETFFSDQKSRGFNIDKSHLSSPQVSAWPWVIKLPCRAWITDTIPENTND